MIWTFLLKPFAAVKRFVITHWRIVLDLSLIIGTSLLARWFFLRFMPSTTVSGDMYEWVRIGQVLADGKNPYVVTDTLSYWPPFWIHILFLMAKLSLRTGLPYFRLIQAVLIFSETLLLGVLYIVLRRVAPTKHPLVLVFLGVSINPICILLICQHCNFDVIIVLCILLSLAMLFEFSKTQEPTSWLLAWPVLGCGGSGKNHTRRLGPAAPAFVSKAEILYEGIGRNSICWPGYLGCDHCLGPRCCRLSSENLSVSIHRRVLRDPGCARTP